MAEAVTLFVLVSVDVTETDAVSDPEGETVCVGLNDSLGLDVGLGVEVGVPVMLDVGDAVGLID